MDDAIVDVPEPTDTLGDGLYTIYMGRYSSRLLIEQGKFRYQASEVSTQS